jgi:MFS family permease
MQFSTISLQIYYEHTDDPLIQGLIGLTEAIPFVITCFFSGVVADTYNRRKILLAGIFVLFIGCVLLYFHSASFSQFLKNTGMTVLFSIVFLFGIIRAFLAACTHPFMSQLVPRHHYTHSATWNSTAWHVGAILGPVLAGVIYGYNNKLNADTCYLIDCILFLISIWFIFRIGNKPKPVREEKETLIQAMSVGLKFVFKNKMVLSALSLDLFAVLFGGAVAMIPMFTDKILHLGPEAYGLLRTAPAIGAVLMALIMAVKPPAKKAGQALIWSVIGFGAFTIAFAFCTNYWLAILMLMMTGAFDNVSVVVRHSILQLSTPDNMRGRVTAVNNIFIGSSNEIGAFESGVAAKTIGLVPSIVFGGAMVMVTVLGISKLNPNLKKMDLTKYQ